MNILNITVTEFIYLKHYLMRLLVLVTDLTKLSTNFTMTKIKIQFIAKHKRNPVKLKSIMR